MKRYRHKLTVLADQFLPEKKPWPSAVSKGKCYCMDLAQDGRHCEIHTHNGKPYYEFHGAGQRRGEYWVVRRIQYVVRIGQREYVVDRVVFERDYEHVAEEVPA